MNNVTEYLYRKASINKIPLSGVFELSPVCNFTCKMCYVRKSMEQIAGKGMRLKSCGEWLALAKKCREEGMLYLLLTGGEPFLYPAFRELYEELHKMGFLISINTNGTLFDESIIAWLKDRAPFRMNVTLYGASEETYQRICGQADGYVRAKNAIMLIKEAGIQVVVNASMIPENACDLEDIIEFGKNNHVFTRISTYMFPPVRREKESADSRFSPEDSARIYLRKQYCELDTESYGQFLKDNLSKVNIDSSKDSADNWGTNLEYMRCRAGRSSFWVSWDGTMTACGLLPFPVEEYPFERPFRDCWLELTNKVRTTKVLASCNVCEKKEICNPCVAMVYAETGNVNGKSDYLCNLAECVITGMKNELQEKKTYEKKENN